MREIASFSVFQDHLDEAERQGVDVVCQRTRHYLDLARERGECLDGATIHHERYGDHHVYRITVPDEDGRVVDE